MTLILSYRDEFRSTIEAAAKEKASAYNVNLTTQDANNDTGKIIQFIEAAKNSGEDAVLINLIDSSTSQECIKAADGMPLVFCNISPDDLSCLNEIAAMVASDNYEAGQRQGEYIADYCEANGMDSIKYVMMQGTLGMIHTEQRTAGALETLEARGIKAEPATAPLVGDYDRSTAMDQISPLIGVEEFDTIICNNDAMALGCIEALKAHGEDPSNYIIVGVDCTADGAVAIQNGEMKMTVFQDPEGQGSGSMQAAINMIEGKDLIDGMDYKKAEDNEYVIWVPFQTVTAENVDKFIK